jgi:uncharacterized protein
MDRWGIPVELGTRRVLHAGPLRWLRAVGWMFLLFFMVALPSYGSLAIVTSALPDNEVVSLSADVLAAVVSLVVYAALVWGGEDRTPSEIAPGRAVIEILVGLAIGLLMFSSVMAIMAAFGLYDITWRGLASPLEGLGLSIQSGTVEEVLSRAVVLRLVWRAFGPWVAFAFSAALFGALHLSNPNSSPFAAICIAVEAGIMLGAFYALSGRIWVSIGVHAAWNFTQGYIFGAAVSGTDFGPAMMSSVARPQFAEWLTGGRFGPEASLPALLVGTSIGVFVLVLAWWAGRFRKPDVLLG